jgi:hypothetical protein
MAIVALFSRNWDRWRYLSIESLRARNFWFVFTVHWVPSLLPQRRPRFNKLKAGRWVGLILF